MPNHEEATDIATIRSIVPPLVAIVLGAFMVVLDNTVVNVALPTLGRVFATDLSLLQWVITAYILAQAAVIPLAGWLADLFGAKRVFLTSLVFFSLGSVLCAVAPSAEALVAARVFQGLGGGMVLPIGMSVIYRLTPPDRRGAVMAMYGVPVMVAPAVGPVLSGWLLQFAEWWFVFIINVPIGAAALLVGLRVLPSLPPARATLGRPDTLGVVLGPLAFASLSYGISQSAHAGWSGASTLGGVAVGLVALGLFVWRELSVGEPLLELRVFRRRDFALTIVTQWAGFASMFGTFFLVPLFLQQVRGYGSFQTGLFTFPQAVAAALFMPIGGRLFDGFGARAPVVAGMTMAAAAMGLLSGLTGATTGDDLRAPLVLMGGGMGLIVMSLNTHLLNSAPRELVGRVTSLSSALQNVVGSLGIAGAATILQSRLPVRLDEAARAAGGQPAPGALQDAAAFAFGDVYRAATFMLAVAWLLAWTLRRQPTATSSRPAGAPTAPREMEREPVVGGRAPTGSDADGFVGTGRANGAPSRVPIDRTR